LIFLSVTGLWRKNEEKVTISTGKKHTANSIKFEYHLPHKLFISSDFNSPESHIAAVKITFFGIFNMQ
jgi:hypothetical protein